MAAAGAGLSGAALLEACRAGKAEPAPQGPPRAASPTATGGPLRAVNGRLVDGAGQGFLFSGVNWFGCETDVFAPHGLWARAWGDMLDQVVTSGFNSLRIPFSNQFLEAGRMPTSIDYSLNADLKGRSGLEVLDRILDGCAARRLRVILDRHRPTAAAPSELWYTDQVPEARWIDDWVMLANRYRHQPAVIGADLHNEPHGAATWGDGNQATDWRLAAERAGNAVLAANPDWLILVEGVERYAGDYYWWGGNLAGAKDSPVRLSAPERLVYSAHDYGPEVYAQPWFGAADFPDSLPDVWRRHWAYLQLDSIAPVLLGEFGGRSVGQDPEGKWQRGLVEFLKSSRIGWTYWSWNPDSGDTGGVLEDDWKTVDAAKLALLATDQQPLR